MKRAKKEIGKEGLNHKNNAVQIGERRWVIKA